MGLADLFGTVTLKYKADTDQAKAALRELTGEQKKNAQAAIVGMEDQQKAHDRMVKGITIGLGLTAGAVALGISVFKSYEERVRLTTASSGADMDKLRTASRGLLTDLELMGIAAQGMNGRFKLTSDEMANVLGAAVALERQGFGPLAEITKKLGDSMRKGEIDPLKELGVAYDEVLAKTDKRAAAMKALAALSREAADGIESETERLRAHATTAENYVDRAKAGIGQVAAETVAGLVIINDALLGMRESFKEWVTEDLTFAEITIQARMMAAFAEVEKNARKIRALNAGADADAAEAARKRGEDEAYVDFLRGKRMDAQRAAIEKQKSDSAARAAANRRGGGGSRRPAARDTSLDDDIRLGRGPIETMGAGSKEPDFLGDSAVGSFGAGGQGFNRLSDEPSFMEKHFGPVEQFDAYASAWGGFTDAASAGYTALVTGSESAGKAMKRIIAQSIMAEGQHMMIRALREAAEAIGALASGNIPKAGAHALAAAKFGAGAAIAGVVARGLGAGGSTGSGESGTSGGSAPSGINLGGGKGGDGTDSRIFVIGDSYGDESARQRALRFGRQRRLADSYDADARGVDYR